MTTTAQDLKQMTELELENELKKAGMDLYKLRLAVTARQSKETFKLKALRKHIARIKTVQKLMKLERIKEQPKSAVTK